MPLIRIDVPEGTEIEKKQIVHPQLFRRPLLSRHSRISPA